MEKVTIAELNAADRADFLRLLGGIFEHSPWVAEAVCDQRPFEGKGDLHRAMQQAVEHAGDGAQLALLRAHPDLAGRAALADKLTEHSRREQAGAGLDQLTPEEYVRFQRLNEAYVGKFGFPFIIAVKGRTKQSILDRFTARLANTREQEIRTALDEVYRIARLRLEDLVPEPS